MSPSITYPCFPGEARETRTVKRLRAMLETWVQFHSQEDPLEKEMAIYSSTLAWKIPWMEELGAGYYPWGRKESGTTE